MSKEKYQEALDSLECNAIQWASNHKYNEKHNFYIDNEMCDEMLNHSKVLQELVDLYPEYLELKAKATPKKPNNYQKYSSDSDAWGKCPDCNKDVCDYADKYCPNCSKAIDWSEND